MSVFHQWRDQLKLMGHDFVPILVIGQPFNDHLHIHADSEIIKVITKEKTLSSHPFRELNPTECIGNRSFVVLSRALHHNAEAINLSPRAQENFSQHLLLAVRTYLTFWKKNLAT